MPITNHTIAERIRRFAGDFGPFKTVARQLPPSLRAQNADPTRWVVRSKVGEDVACCACEDIARMITRLLNDHQPAPRAEEECIRLRVQLRDARLQISLDTETIEQLHQEQKRMEQRLANEQPHDTTVPSHSTVEISRADVS